MDRPSPKLFFQKNRLPNKISKNQVSRRNIFSSFLKVLATFYKEISKIISTIFMKERQQYEFINASLLYGGNWLKSFPTATLSFKILFSKRLTTREQHVSIWKRFFSVINCQLALEIGTVSLIVHDHTAQKMKFSITDFFSKYDQIRSFLQIWSHSLKKSVMENFIFCTVSSIVRRSNLYFLLL